jgi:hypothetical protein
MILRHLSRTDQLDPAGTDPALDEAVPGRASHLGYGPVPWKPELRRREANQIADGRESDHDILVRQAAAMIFGDLDDRTRPWPMDMVTTWSGC